jgi:hypothetical protein
MIRGFQPSPPAIPVLPKYSRLGLASFALGIVSLILACAFIILAATLGIEAGVEPGRAVSMTGLVLLAVILPVALVGTVLGLAGLSQAAQKKVYALLGAISNALTLSTFCLLIVLALIGFRPAGV